MVQRVFPGRSRGEWSYRLVSLLAAVALTAVSLVSPAPTASAAQPTIVYFPETGHHLSDRFLTMWRTHGGLAIFGYPITEAIDENGLTAQYFERARFELHPEHVGTPYDVELTLLGRALIQERDEQAFHPFPADSAAPDSPDRVFFAATGHYLAYGFKTYWETHGGLAIFGYPISEELSENGRTVQYFERARFEWWPEHRGTPYEIQLGRLGADAAAAAGVATAAVPRAPGASDYGDVSFAQSLHLPVLMYHRFGDAAGRYEMSLWKFGQQLDWLQQNGYHTVTLDQVYGYMEGIGTLPSKPIVITFDDGYDSQWGAAAALDDHGMHGVFFITTAQGGLTASQIRSLADRGHEIGSHTVTHPDLRGLSDGQLAYELQASKATLEADTGRPVNFFAYPYGDIDSRTINAVANAGYRGALHAWGGKEWTPDKRWVEPRVEVSGLSSLSDFVAAVQ